MSERGSETEQEGTSDLCRMIGIELNHIFDSEQCLRPDERIDNDNKLNMLRRDETMKKLEEELEKEVKEKLINWNNLDEQELLRLFHNRISEKLNNDIEDKRLTVPHYHSQYGRVSE